MYMQQCWFVRTEMLLMLSWQISAATCLVFPMLISHGLTRSAFIITLGIFAQTLVESTAWLSYPQRGADIF